MKGITKDKWQLILLLANMIISGTIIIYFWSFFPDYSKRINIFIMIIALVYIAIEMLKKILFKSESKLGRLYYLGLLAIIAPIALKNKISLESIKMINQIGILFLLVPLLIEGRQFIKSKNQ